MKLRDVATIRSKNAEPWMTTCDIFFNEDATYRTVKSSGFLDVERVARLYGIPVEAVYGVFYLDSVRVVKVTLYKYGKNGYMGSGDPWNPDHYGSQQQIPLAELELPAAVARQ